MRRRVYNKDYFNGYSYVDLGLPSGLLWATKDIGAKSETDLGLYFQWGDPVGYTEDQVTSGQKRFSESDYKWAPPSGGLYCSKYNYLDNKTVLDPEDDAAHVNMGKNWRIPTTSDWLELVEETEYSYSNGIVTLTSPYNGLKIYFPITGKIGYNGGFQHDLYYWSNELVSSGYRNNAYCADFKSIPLTPDTAAYRYRGQYVRGVIDPPVINIILILIQEGGEL